MHTYNNNEIDIIVNGIRMEGLAEDSYCTVERAEDAFTMKHSADGVTTRSKTNNTAGMVTIRLMYSSLSNAVLSAIANIDEQTGHGVVSVLIKHRGTGTLLTSASGWVRKHSNAEFGKEVQETEWPMDCANLNIAMTGIPVEEVA